VNPSLNPEGNRSPSSRKIKVAKPERAARRAEKPPDFTLPIFPEGLNPRHDPAGNIVLRTRTPWLCSPIARQKTIYFRFANKFSYK
jgi:hypothetical protein